MSAEAEGMKKVLDLYCGAGGAAAGYARAGFHVTGVDLEPQPNYPFDFTQADALEVDLDGYDLIHASPPCQRFSAYRRKGHGVGDGYPDLIGATRERLVGSDTPYVIENVPGAPLLEPIQLCGSSFGLDVRRHRLFECSWDLKAPSCDHRWQTPRFPPATNRKNLRSTVEVGVWRIPLDTQKSAMGVNWECTLKELSQMVPPAYTEWIGLRAVNKEKSWTPTERLSALAAAAALRRLGNGRCG